VTNSIDKIISKQNVRLLDVFLIAPFIIYAGSKQTNKSLKYGLYTIGVLTLIYNGINYLENKKYANEIRL
jgi:hypothetical protein